MTKADLLKALDAFRDDQFVTVLLHKKNTHDRYQLAIQAVAGRPPWNKPNVDESNWIISIECHEENVEFDPVERAAELQERRDIAALWDEFVE